MSDQHRVGDVLTLTYEVAVAMPVGTVIADLDRHWSRLRRRYVKTTDNTWALFFRELSPETYRNAIEERRNNSSPCPQGVHVRIATIPKEKL